MTTITEVPPAKLYNPEERKTGVSVRNLFLKIFESWKLADFERMVSTRKAVDPVYLWALMEGNPLTRLATNAIKGHIKANEAARIFAGFKIEEVLDQIRVWRPDLYTLAITPGGRNMIEFYLKGFKQCMCPHPDSFIKLEGNKPKCTLCGKGSK